MAHKIVIIECYLDRSGPLRRVLLTPSIKELRKAFNEGKRDGLYDNYPNPGDVFPDVKFDDLRIISSRLVDMDDQYFIYEVEAQYELMGDDFGLSAHDVESMMIG